MKHDLIIIGSGPAGYVAAIRAGQTGLKTLVIDRQYVGGMCLNWGCIPTKNLLESAKLFRRISTQASEFGITGIDKDKLEFDWKQALKRNQGIVAKLSRGIEYLWKKNGVDFLKAEASIISPTQVKAGEAIYEANYIMVATGSRPAPQKLFPKAVEIDELLKLETLPEKPVLYGRGAIIAELAQFFGMIGKKVVVVQSDSPLIPGLDPYLESFILKRMKKDKISIFQEKDIQVLADSIKQGESYHEYDMVINCSLRKAVLPTMDITLEQRDGYLVTDEDYRSSVPTIFAAGDVNGKSYLAHAASSQALRVINTINGINNDIPSQYPINIYTDPELAQLGNTETQLQDQGIEYRTREFGFNANGKALAEGNSDGFVRLLYEPRYHQVLGVQIAGSNATDLISEASVLMQLEGTIFDLANAVHAHPTISEVFMEVAREAETP